MEDIYIFFPPCFVDGPLVLGIDDYIIGNSEQLCTWSRSVTITG